MPAREELQLILKGDVAGSNKKYSFAFPVNPESKRVHLFESAIDLMSYATLLQMEGMNWRRANLLSLSGIYQPKKEIAESKLPAALTQYLEDYPHINSVMLHLDNDKPGRLAAKTICTVMPEGITVINRPPPHGKDYKRLPLCSVEKNLIQKNRKGQSVDFLATNIFCCSGNDIDNSSVNRYNDSGGIQNGDQ